MNRWIIILISFFTSCFVKFPLYKDNDLIEVPELTGVWIDVDYDSSIYILTKQAKNTYKLMHENKYDSSRSYYVAKFLRLNGQLFMDSQIADVEYKVKEESHIITKITSDNSQLKISFFNSEYLVDLAKNNKIKLSYQEIYDNSSGENSGSYTLITESTEKLQKLITDYANDQNVFPAEGSIRLKLKTR